MTDMKVAVRLRRKPGTDLLIFTFSQIFFYDLFYKVFGNGFFSCLFFQFTLLHLWYLSLGTYHFFYQTVSGSSFCNLRGTARI